MNAEDLLRHYERVADAPEAVTRLRRFVLDLAVRGKLVPQVADDGSASQLLQRVVDERERSVRAGELSKPKPLPAIDEAPYVLPETWAWVRIREVTADRGQAVPKAPFTYIDVTSINKEVGAVADPKTLTPDEAPSRARKLARRGDVIYSCVRPNLLNVAVIESDFEPALIVSTAFAVLNGFGLVLPRYIWIVLRSPPLVAAVEEDMRGQAYPAINDAEFSLLPFPLPPLAEQHRIVAKVDELIALCDRLEAVRAEREAARDRLTAASLARLNTPDPETFREDARFAVDALPALTARSDHIGQLRQALVGVAVRGRLLPQFSSDESADRALRRLLEHKQALIAKKQVRQGKVSQPAGSEGPSTELPKGWVWARVDDLCFKVTDGTHFTPKYTSSGIRFVSAKDIVEGKLTFERCKFISPEEHKELYRRCNPEWHDIVISKSGSIGSVALVEDRGEFSLFERLALLKFDQATINPRFLVYSLRHACASLKAGHVRGIGVKHLHLDVLRGLTLALPPPDEQGRIVAKLDELMALCGQLEAALTASEVRRRGLLESLLHEALEPASTEGEVE